MVNNVKYECSVSTWYPRFTKNCLEAIIIPITENILKYLEQDAFVLPVEATKSAPCSSEWSDGLPLSLESDDSECEPTFPEFSKQIQDVIDEFGAVFVKSNWSTPSDATWVTPTKSLKCTTLEEVYLLLKSSDKISRDLSTVKKWEDNKYPLEPCLVLKRWRDINPCTEFRCFVVKDELIGICQRDLSQYHRYIELEKYDIQRDIKSLYLERIKRRFNSDSYTFDVIRYKKDRVKIIDFGLLNASAVKGTLFTYEELNNYVDDAPEFRFIAEDMGIQPNSNQHFCMPQEISEFLQLASQMSAMDIIQREVENEEHEDEELT